MMRRPSRSTRTDTLCPNTTRFRARGGGACTGTRSRFGLLLVDRGAGLLELGDECRVGELVVGGGLGVVGGVLGRLRRGGRGELGVRSEEHTSELQSLMRNSYAVFCLTKKNSDHTTLNCRHYI